MRLAAYTRSVRYLKPLQLYYRLWMLARRNLLHRWPAYTALYRRHIHHSDRVNPFNLRAGVHPRQDREDIRSGAFTFLNHRRELGWPVNWFPSGVTQLWLYNLHYFDYAPELGWEYVKSGHREPYELFRDLVRHWTESCPVGKPIAWDPYPVSLRVRNWIWAYSLFKTEISPDSSFSEELRQSLYVQARFLEDNLEYHLSGNHLLENGRALLLAGLFFADGHAAEWRRKGEHILWHGLNEQFAEDGGHYERSPMYHQLMLGLYREVVSVLESRGQAIPAPVKAKLVAMTDWLRAVLHPDGEIPLLNDAAFGIAGSPAELTARAQPARDGLTALEASGYYIFRDEGTRDFLIFDCGPLGPDHQPGHGHCDALSYELSVSGKRLIVDSGVGNYYGDLEWRHYFRSTRAHNTIVVDDREQSEIWSRFRVGRRAYPLELKWAECGPELAYVVGSHSGYRRLKGDVVHRRWFTWIDRNFWVVLDHVSGRGVHRVESLIHFHPEVRILSTPQGDLEKTPSKPLQGEVERGDLRLKIVPFGVQSVSTCSGEVAPIHGWYAPEFGLRQENHVWSFSFTGELPKWSGYVLWPRSTTEIEVDFSVTAHNRCDVCISSSGGLRRIRFEANRVTFEDNTEDPHLEHADAR